MRQPQPLRFVAIILQLMLSAVLTCRAQESAAEDSLRREILRLAVRDAELEAERTDLWHRLWPRVELSAGLAVGDLLFAGPDAATYVLPKDSYRLSIGLALGGLVDASPHEKALIALSRRRTELSLAEAQEQEARRSKVLLESRRDTLRAILAEELALKTESARFHAMLFEQGKTGFDDLLRSKFALLAARRSLIMLGRPEDVVREEK